MKYCPLVIIQSLAFIQEDWTYQGILEMQMYTHTYSWTDGYRLEPSNPACSEKRASFCYCFAAGTRCSSAEFAQPASKRLGDQLEFKIAGLQVDTVYTCVRWCHVISLHQRLDLEPQRLKYVRAEGVAQQKSLDSRTCSHPPFERTSIYWPF